MSEQKNQNSAPATDPMAVWSMVLGILSYVSCGVFSAIPAVILGHISLGNIKKSNGRLNGKGMTYAGLILGYINIALTVFSIFVILILIFIFGVALFKGLNLSH